MSMVHEDSTRPNRVRVLGNINFDLLISGVPVLPSWGNEVVGSSRALHTAGQGGYIACGLGALEVPVVVAGVVGDDADGESLLADLAGSGVDTGGVRVVPGRTGLTVAIVRGDGERAFVSDLGVSAQVSAGVFLDCIGAQAAEYTIIAGTSNTPGISWPELTGVLEQASRDSVTVFDPGWDPEGYPEETRDARLAVLQHVDLYLPNEEEAVAVTGAADVEDALRELQRVTRGRVVVKCGARGSIALGDDGGILTVASPRVEVANAVGAGDVFDAGLVTALLDGLELIPAMEFASHVAAHYVSRSQDRFPRRSDVADSMQRTER